MFRFVAAAAWLPLTLFGCGSPDPGPSPEVAATTVAAVDAARIANADAEPVNWMSHGRTYGEQRFSPLAQIHAGNIEQLSLAWFYDLPTRRGIEATPLVVDGVMYTTGSWSRVYAFDARDGELLWQYDPGVPRVTAAKACCDAVNRGPAVWNGRVYVGAFDGRLIALDAATGELAWETMTVDPKLNLTITGAPRIVNGLVVIGNGGADMGPVRGYVSAYAADSGELAWRFYTVPGNPEDGFENDAMAMAAETWTGEWWRHGPGGTVWDSMAYDAELNLLYIGVGNGAPWNQRIRSPGGGDNLFLSSIVALNATTGEYVWHYQTTPGEVWDYTATQHIILADLTLDGTERKVLLQAPKNGFFYVIDRTDGAFISAAPYTEVNWATHIDPDTGRPVETSLARYPGDEPQLIIPGPGGAHNWQPMAYSPVTGLVYVPVLVTAFPFQNIQPFNLRPGAVLMGVEYSGFAPPENVAAADVPPIPPGYLSAWDPVAQREVWRVEQATTWNGGTLVTAGDLVFQGTADGFFKAFSATHGAELWSSPAYTGVMAAPITYQIDDAQYVTVMAGWGGVLGIHATPFLKGIARDNHSRVLTYRLGGEAVLPKSDPSPDPPPPPTVDWPVADVSIDRGRLLFDRYCQFCHGAGGISGGLIADLRYADKAVHETWQDIVLRGSAEAAGMPSFAQYIDAQESDAIRTYVLYRARQEREFRSAETRSD
jgi:PQQ-dependent dehydrogenase (methanol/ethanol family)